MSTNPFPVDDVSLTAVADLMSSSGVDTIWLDLDGDLVPETMVQVTDGPFALDDSQPAVEEYDDATLADDLVGEPIATLLPWESGAGTTDVWALPSDGTDWTSMDCYDPMAVPSDWTVDGWADPTGGAGAEAPFPVDADGGFADDSGYYDSTGYTDSTGYFDSTGYYDGSGDVYDPTTIDTWDTSLDTSAYDSGYSDPTTTYDTGIETGYDDYTLSDAADESMAWTDVANQNYDAEWDLWRESNEASLNGNEDLAYDLNSASLDANAAGDQAWTYADETWADYDAYDSAAYDTSYDTSWDTTSYDTTSTDSWDTTSTDATTDW